MVHYHRPLFSPHLSTLFDIYRVLITLTLSAVEEGAKFYKIFLPLGFD